MHCISNALRRAGGLALALLLPSLAFAGIWTLPSSPAVNTGYNFAWSGSVSANNQLAMMEYQAPGSTTWSDCGAGFPGSNYQATVTGGGGFDRQGTWKFRIVQEINGSDVTCDQTQLTVGTPIVDNTPPTTPGNPIVTNVTATTANLSWGAATDNVAVTGYAVSVNGTQRLTTTSTVAALTGLTPSTSYSVSIVAFDAAGNRSTAASAQFQTLAAPSTPLGWSQPLYSATTLNTFAQFVWAGSTSSSTVLMSAQAPGSSLWRVIGSGSGSNPKTVNGALTLNQRGTWVIVVRDGTSTSSPILATKTIYVY